MMQQSPFPPAIAARLLLEAAIRAGTFKILTDGPHKFASTQVQLTGALAQEILAFGARIPDEDLADDGRETTPHVTVKYGLHDNEPDDIQALLSDASPVRVKLGPIKIFQPEGKDYDVIVIAVTSLDLHQMNDLIAKSVDVTDTHPTYRPHVTIAYVKRGLGAAYKGDTTFAGRQIVCDEVMFCPADGEKTMIPLEGRTVKAAHAFEHIHPESEAELLRVLEAAILSNNTDVIDQIFGLRTAFDPDQPRAEDGKWSDTGGGASGEGGSGKAEGEWVQALDKNGRPIPIKVKNMADAIDHVLSGRVVEMKSVGEAHTLIDKLAEIAAEAQQAGVEAKDYNLCNVQAAGSNIFCAENLRTKKYPNGVPRLLMPQLGGMPVKGSEADKLPKNKKGGVDAADKFVKYLRDSGIETEEDRVKSSSLKASQNELIGSKVASAMKWMEEDREDKKSDNKSKNAIFVSRDNYILDGHHRWAASVGKDAADGKLGDSRMNVVRIDAPITELLQLSMKWTKDFGIEQAAGVKKQAMKMNAKQDAFYQKYIRGRGVRADYKDTGKTL